MPRPNFFIVGGPKCGTTSLYHCLRHHPQVFMPDIKEPVYFGTDLRFDPRLCLRPTIHQREAYLELFAIAGDVPRIGEATVWYLYSTVAAREIHAFDPRSRIIIMLRNPVDVMYSLHGEFLWDCNEHITDFAEALAAQGDRKQGRGLAPTCHFPQGLLYEDVVAFAEQVQRFFDVFGRDEVCVVVFDDFVQDTPGTYRGVFEYLGIDTGFQSDLRRFNPSKPQQLRPINRFLAARPGMRRLFNRMVPQSTKRMVIELAARAARSQHRTRRLDPRLRAELQVRMAPAIDRLGDLLGRDLTHWYRPPADGPGAPPHRQICPPKGA